MTPVDALSQLAAGLSMALVLFAAMLLMTFRRHLPLAPPGAIVERARRLNGSAWSAIACGILLYRPVHTAWLLGRPAPKAWALLGDVTATALFCAGLIMVLAARGLLIGLHPARVTRGLLVNVTVAIAIVVAAWLTR